MPRLLPFAIVLAAIASPARGSDAPGPELVEKAKAMFAATAAGTCDAGDPGSLKPDSHAIAFRHAYDAPDDPQRMAYLFRFFCFSGAYNEIHVYYISDGEDGLSPLYFAEPVYDVRYAGDTDEQVEAITLTGSTASGHLVNSVYDADRRTITAHSLWRGPGDASSLGIWAFADGGFRLVRFEVDASYDGRINPQVLVDYPAAP